MDLVTLLIGIGTLAVMVLPILLFQYSNKRKAAKKLKDLINQAKSSGINISKHDILNEQLIGIDTIVKKLILFNITDDACSFKIFDLKDFQSCILNVERRGGKSNNSQNSIIEKIYLVLKPFNHNSSDSKIGFYDNSVNMSIYNELELAEKWEKLICETIAK